MLNSDIKIGARYYSVEYEYQKRYPATSTTPAEGGIILLHVKDSDGNEMPAAWVFEHEENIISQL